MDYAATVAQMKELDRCAIQELGIPSLNLMESAAAAVARAVMERVPLAEGAGESPAPRIAVFCGPGNNGGDGVAAARLLREAGYQVRAFLVGKREKMTPDERAMEEKLLACGGTLEPFALPPEAPSGEDSPLLSWLSACDGFVDALFGVGLKRPVAGDFRIAVELLNRLGSRAPVVACDVPSGLDADTGSVLGVAVRASCTVTFSCCKPGFFLAEGEECCGQVVVADIGIPRELIDLQVRKGPAPVQVMRPGERISLPRRPRNAHKGVFGRLFLLAGSQGYTGAPTLAAQAALRTGAGLVFLGVPRDIYPIVAVKCQEAMPFPLPESYEAIRARAEGCDAVLLGPGLGRAAATEELVRSLLQDLTGPVVLDADGISAVAGHLDILDARRGPTILTPHDGEFQRLSGCTLPIRDRVGAARDFAWRHHCILVLKGHGTVVASPEGRTILCAAGNPGMATGGSGDVLAGILVSLLGQGHLRGPEEDLTELTAAGVWIHALAGDLCARELGEYGMLPSDMIEALPRILRQLEQGGDRAGGRGFRLSVQR